MKRLVRNREGQWVTGICGGIARTWDLDPLLVRLAFIFLGIVTELFPLLITYLIGWYFIPRTD